MTARDTKVASTDSWWFYSSEITSYKASMAIFGLLKPQKYFRLYDQDKPSSLNYLKTEFPCKLKIKILL